MVADAAARVFGLRPVRFDRPRPAEKVSIPRGVTVIIGQRQSRQAQEQHHLTDRQRDRRRHFVSNTLYKYAPRQLLWYRQRSSLFYSLANVTWGTETWKLVQKICITVSFKLICHMTRSRRICAIYWLNSVLSRRAASNRGFVYIWRMCDVIMCYDIFTWSSRWCGFSAPSFKFLNWTLTRAQLGGGEGWTSPWVFFRDG